MGSSSIFRTCRSYAPGAPPILLRGKLGALPPGPAGLLPRTRPSSNGMNGLYGHSFYGNGTATATATATALWQRIRNAGKQALPHAAAVAASHSVLSKPMSCAIHRRCAFFRLEKAINEEFYPKTNRNKRKARQFCQSRLIYFNFIL